MLLKSLIDQIKTKKGTPGTPDENCGVPDFEPLKPAPINNLSEAEHQEHREHQKTDDYNQTRKRNSTRREHFQVYEAIGQRYTKKHWVRLVALPGWKAKLDELEQGFTEAWQAGGDCWQEFEALRDHWREGLRAIREVKAA